MASKQRILRSWNDVTRIEQNIYVLIPYVIRRAFYARGRTNSGPGQNERAARLMTMRKIANLVRA